MRHRMRMRLDFLQQLLRFQFGQDFLTCFKTLQPHIFFRRIAIDMGVIIKNIDLFQLVAFADLEVVEVVRRGHLHRASAEFRIDIIIGNDWNQATHDGQHSKFADNIGVAFILRIYDDCRITQHGFRACRCNCHETFRRTFNRVTDVIHVTLDVLRQNFQIGNRGVEFRVPVYKALITVDQAFLMQLDKRLTHGFVQAFIHCKTFTRPVRRRAQTAQLINNGTARLFFPLPDLFEESLAAQITAIDPLSRQLTLDDHLGRDTGMVGTRLPQRILAVHAVIAHEDIVQRIIQRMPHMQAAGHVRRRHHDCEGFCIPCGIGCKGARGFPFFIKGLFNGLRIKGFLEHFHISN